MRPVDALKQSYAAEIARCLEEHPVNGLYLSDAGGCPRMRVLKALNAPHRPRSAREAQIFRLGDVVHRELWRRIAEVWPNAQREVWLDTPYGRARIDAVVEAENLIIEIKKAKLAAIDYLPKREHVLQLQSYMHFSPYRRGVLLYGIVGMGIDEVPFGCDYDPEVGRGIEEELQHLQRLVDLQTPPPVPQGYGPVEYPCSWYDKELGARHRCAYGEHCWKEWGGM